MPGGKTKTDASTVISVFDILYFVFKIPYFIPGETIIFHLGPAMVSIDFKFFIFINFFFRAVKYSYLLTLYILNIRLGGTFHCRCW